MSVKTGAHEHKLWLDLVRRFFQSALEVGVILLARRTVADGCIERVAQSLAAAGLGRCSRAGIKAAAVAMNTVEHDARLFIENILRPVAVMHVPIDDEETCQLMSRLRMVRGQGNVIEKTETHARGWCRMMPRWADEAEGPAVRPPQH